MAERNILTALFTVLIYFEVHNGFKGKPFTIFKKVHAERTCQMYHLQFQIAS